MMKTNLRLNRFVCSALTAAFFTAGALAPMAVGSAWAQSDPASGRRIAAGLRAPGRENLAIVAQNGAPGPANPADPQANGARAKLGVRLTTDEHIPAVLQAVERNSPADQAGLRAGDQVLAIGGVRVKSAAEFVTLLRKQNWSHDLRILIDRDGHARQLLVRAGTIRSSSKPDEHAQIGVVLSTNNPTRGVLVAETYPGGPADEAGLRTGDLITAVNGKRITNPQELQAVIREHRPGDELDLSVNRQGWRRNFLLISIGLADLAKLPSPAPAPAGAAAPAATVGTAPAASATPPAERNGAGDKWQDIRDVNRRALYTDFD